MAFSFDTLKEDKKQTAIDVVDTITPSQVKQISQAYKDGLNADPKQVINETLENFTGIDLSQGAAAGVKDFVKGQAADLTMQLEQQILGCINTQIRDLLNKVPELDFILNFEDRINGILGKFRNDLERKIDAELRKLTYKKLKIHQVALFKQRIRQQIKNICPGATPASVAEVQEFNRNIKGFFDKRKAEAAQKEISDDVAAIDSGVKTLPKEEISTKPEEIAITPTPADGMSNTLKRDLKDETTKKEIVKENVEQAAAVVEAERKEQLNENNKEGDQYDELVNTTPTEEDIFRPFKWENHRWLYFGQLASSNRSRHSEKVRTGILPGDDEAVVKKMVDSMFEGLIGVRSFKEYVDTGIDHTKNKALKKAMDDAKNASWLEAVNNPESKLLASLWFEPVSYDSKFNTLNVTWFFRLELAGKEEESHGGVRIKAKPAEIILNINRKFTIYNSSPKAAIYEAQEYVKDKMNEFIHRTPLYRGSESSLLSTEFEAENKKI